MARPARSVLPPRPARTSAIPSAERQALLVHVPLGSRAGRGGQRGCIGRCKPAEEGRGGPKRVAQTTGGSPPSGDQADPAHTRHVERLVDDNTPRGSRSQAVACIWPVALPGGLPPRCSGPAPSGNGTRFRLPRQHLASERDVLQAELTTLSRAQWSHHISPHRLTEFLDRRPGSCYSEHVAGTDTTEMASCLILLFVT